MDHAVNARRATIAIAFAIAIVAIGLLSTGTPLARLPRELLPGFPLLVIPVLLAWRRTLAS